MNSMKNMHTDVRVKMINLMTLDGILTNLNLSNYQELTLRMERMTDDATKKKRELEHELTLTMTAQVSNMPK